MRSLLNNLTLAHDDDLVCGHDGRQAMRDHDHRLLLLLQESVQSLLDLVFAFSIECTGGLIEKQDARLADEGASDSDSLLLATREAHATLTHFGIHTIGEKRRVQQKAATSLLEGSLESFLDLSIGELGAVKAVQHVVSNRAREEARLLLHNSELGLMVPLSVNLLDVVIVEEHFTTAWVVETLNQGNDGGFAAAGVTDQGHGLAVLHIDVDAFEHGHVRLGRVAELNVLKSNRAFIRCELGLSDFLLIIVALLVLRLRDQACNLVKGTLNLGHCLQVGVKTENAKNDLPDVQQVRGNLSRSQIPIFDRF